MKAYISETFKTRIEVNLANISTDPNNEFKLEKAYYDYLEFECELCGHKHCMYAFEVKNIETEKIIKVGSECIHHFKDRGVDIDLAEGLMKRVMNATNKARRQLKESLAMKVWDNLSDEKRTEIYKYYNPKWNHAPSHVLEEIGKQEMKKLSKEEKAKMTIEAYIVEQAKELLYDYSINKAILDSEQIAKIVDLGLSNELEKAEKKREWIHKNQLKMEEDRRIAEENRKKFEAQKLIEKAEIQKMFDKVLQTNNSNFIISINKWFRSYGSLSANQRAILEKIYNSIN